MAQIFVENIFEEHVDWIKLIKTDDNYKNILQVKIQKEFKITPDYLEIEHDIENGYTMGVFLCIGKSIHQQQISDAIPIEKFKNFSKIKEYLLENESVFIFLSSGTHKIKKKSEQIACEKIIKYLES